MPDLQFTHRRKTLSTNHNSKALEFPNIFKAPDEHAGLKPPQKNEEGISGQQ